MDEKNFQEKVPKIEEIDEYFEVKKEEPWSESDYEQNQPTTSLEPKKEPEKELLEPKCEPEEEKQVVLKEEEIEREKPEEPSNSIDYAQMMVSKKKQKPLGIRQINANKRKIDAFFLRSQHPSVQTLTELARSFQFSFDEVFEHFEQLRAKHEVPCDSGDVCCRIRDRFLFATTTNEEFARMVLSPEDEKMLLQEFDKFEDEAPYLELDSSDFHLIMENTNIHPFHIKLEFDKYKKQKMDANCAFPDDLRHFERNQHPSIEEMIQISEETQTDYTIVFRRFDQFRIAQNLICTPNDTCHRVRRYFNIEEKPKYGLTAKAKKIVWQEFEKFEKNGIKEMTCGHVHLIRDIIDLSDIVVRREYSNYKKEAVKKAPSRLQKAIKELQKKFEENSWPSDEQYNEMSNYFEIPTKEIRDFFFRARLNAKKGIYKKI